MICPKCGVTLSDKALARSLASKGSKAGRGHAKARTREQAQAAARVRWDKAKLHKPFTNQKPSAQFGPSFVDSPSGDPCHDNFDID